MWYVITGVCGAVNSICMYLMFNEYSIIMRMRFGFLRFYVSYVLFIYLILSRDPYDKRERQRPRVCGRVCGGATTGHMF